MTKRPNINALANTESSTFLPQLNQNFSNIQEKFDNTLSLDGSLPNAMNADLDLNGNDILNAASVNTDRLRVGGRNFVPSSAIDQTVKKEFETVALLLADTGTYSNYATGDYFRVVNEGFVYQIAASGASDQHIITAGGVKLYSLSFDIDAFGAVGSGSGNQSGFIATAASAGNYIVIGRKPYKITSQVNIPASVFVEGRGGSRYANASQTVGGRLLSGLSISGSAIYRSGTVLQSQGAGISGLSLGSHFDVDAVNFASLTTYGLHFNNVFNEIVENVSVDHFNGTTGIFTSGQCNKLTIVNPRVCNIGTYSYGAGAFSDYGQGIDLGSAPDSEVINPYVEGCGTTGVTINSNSRILGGFIDLCRTGVSMTGERPMIGSRTTMKFHRRNGCVVFNSTQPIIENATISGHNRDVAAWSSADAAGICLSGNVMGLMVKDCDFEPIQQWRGPALAPAINLGPNDGSTAEVVGCQFGDVVSGGQHIVDPNGVWAAGNFSLRDFSLSMGRSRSYLTTSVPFASGLTVTNDKFTVTNGGVTYVAKGSGVTFPWVTTSTFVASQWVALENPDTLGMFFHQNVRTNIGNSRVSGTGTQTAIRLSTDCDVSGVVSVSGCASFLRAGSGSIGPKFVANAAPTTIMTCAQSGSYASLRGWLFPVAVSHTGGGTNENVNVVALPDRLNGRLTLSTGFAFGVAFILSADVTWDGTTLTVSNRVVQPGSFGGTATFINNAGNLALQWSVASARSGTATVDFDGLWTVAG